MQSQTLNALLAGQFICPIAFEQEFEDLQDPVTRDEIEQWLAKIDRRLARIGEEGAFFVAPMQIMAQHTTKVREDLKDFRDTYGPMVSMLNLIRVSKEGFTCSPGDFVQLAEIERGINESPTLEMQLRALVGVIDGSSLKNTNRDFLKRMLEHLKRAGYLVISNPQNETYRVTGKIDHLHAVLDFIAEQKPVIAESPEDTAQTEDMVTKAALEGGGPNV